MVLLFSFLIIAFVGNAQDPPSPDITENCKYVTFRNAQDEVEVAAVDSCFATTLFEGSKTAFQWRCEYDNSTNMTSPVLYTSPIENDCDNLAATSKDGSIYTLVSYNCDSDISCPFASYYRSRIDSLDDIKYSNCSTYNITFNETLVNKVQDSTSAVLTFESAMNVCDGDGSVYTCDNNTIYQWMYNDAQCTDYKDYDIVVANSLDCFNPAFPTKNIITQCVMTSPPTEYPTPSPTEDTMSPTIYDRESTTEAGDANILSTMVNLVALLIVCICVIIQ